MATYDPPLGPARAASSSRSAPRRHANWVCVISDDCSQPDALRRDRGCVGDDPRFVLSRSPRRLGFYRNFERALALAPARRATTSRWPTRTTPGTPTSSRRCSAELGDAQLVYSDARIVDRDGARARRHLLGAAAQQPPRPALAAGGELGHRRGLAVPARPARRRAAVPAGPVRPLPRPLARRSSRSSLGDIAFVDRPLYDYVQHGDATLGHAAANRDAGAARPARPRCAATRASACGCGGCTTSSTSARLLQFATVLCAALRRRAWRRDKRRALERFLRADRSLPALARGCGRAARASCWAGGRETLGAEWMLAYALRLAARCWSRDAPRERPRRLLRLDALPPTRLDPRPAPPRPASRPARAIAEKIAPLRARRARRRARAGQPADPDDRPRALLRGLHRASSTSRGGWPSAGCGCGSSPSTPCRRCRATGGSDVEAYSGLDGLFDQVEVAFGREAQRHRGQPRRPLRRDHLVDRAHRAHAARALDGERFLYLIQEYEPFTFPMGTYAALARRVLPLPARRAVLDRAAARLLPPPRARRLRGRRRGGRRASASFENAITAVDAARRPPSSRRARRAGCSSTRARSRTPRATCSSSACSRLDRALERRRARRAGSCTASAPSTAAGGSTSAAARAWSSCARAGQARYARGAARPRRRPRAHVHAAPEPGADRDGLGGDADGDQQRSRTRPARRWRRSRPT